MRGIGVVGKLCPAFETIKVELMLAQQSVPANSIRRVCVCRVLKGGTCNKSLGFICSWRRKM